MALPFDSVRAASAAARRASPDLGALPQWRLDDLYESMDSPRFAADLRARRSGGEELRRSLSRQARRDRQAPKRRRAAGRGGPRLRSAAGPDRPHHVLRFAPLCRRHQRPARGPNSTATRRRRSPRSPAICLFFELELNRLDDARLDAAMATPALGHYRPWLEDIRKEKPHQLADEHRAIVPRKVGDRRGGVEPAVRRHDRRAALRFRGREPDARAAARQAAGSPTRRSARRPPTRSPRRSAPTCGSSR